MKRLRVSATVDPDDAPEFFNLLANSPDVDEARFLEVNSLPSGVETFLIAIEGDATAFERGARETPSVESVEVSEVRDGQAYALVVIRTLETPMFRAIYRASNERGLIIRTPFTYRDGRMFGSVVGDPESIQRALDADAAGVEVRVDEIGSFEGGRDDPTTALSERQLEAVAVARELGYYDQPRGATHEDVAAELGCAPQTASDHLQKAESKLVDAVLAEYGPGV